MGPLEAILEALKDYDSLRPNNEFGFNVDTHTGDIIVERYNPDSLEVESKSLVRLSTVEVTHVGV